MFVASRLVLFRTPGLYGLNDFKGVLAIRRIFSLVDMVAKPKF